MTNITINSLPTALTIDGASDFLPIYTASALATQKITRNVFLGLASAPVGLTDSQTLTNKTLTSPTISGPTLSGTVIGTYTIGGTPTFPTSVVQLTTVQTLTNKTLTSPTISAPTITNATISADAITGFTTSSNGTVYGVSITGGVIASAALANSVNTAALQTNAVGGSNIATNAITLASVSSTTSQGSVSSADVIITGLTATVTVPAGGRKVRVEVYVPNFSNSSASTGAFLSIYNSATVTGSPIQIGNIFMPTAGTGNILWTFWEGTVSAGSTSYCASVRVSTGTGSTILSANVIAFLTVRVL